jgi:Xaa-Pro aminopeptidase
VIILNQNSLGKLQKRLQKDECVLIIKPENRLYFSGFSGTSAYLLIAADRAFFLTDFRYMEQAHAQVSGYEIVKHAEEPFDTISDLFKQHQFKKLWIEAEYISYHSYKKLLEKIPSLNTSSIIGIDDQIEDLRVIKEKYEVESIKAAAAIADTAFTEMIKQIRPGMSEIHISAILEYEMKKLGSSIPSFETIVASGTRSSLPHGVSSLKVVENGDLIVIDFGATYKGYHSDITRTICIGRANDEQKKLYETVLESQLLAVRSVVAGIKGNELDGIARDYLKSHGYDKEFGHSLGHGVGLEIHENPRISPSSATLLEPNMVITIEPGVYLENKYGVRIEDLLVVTKEGYEILSHTTKELIEII